MLKWRLAVTYALFDLFSEESAVQLSTVIAYVKEKCPNVADVEIYTSINYGRQNGYININHGLIKRGKDEATRTPDVKKIGIYIEILATHSLSRSDIILNLCEEYLLICDAGFQRLIRLHLKEGIANNYYKKRKQRQIYECEPRTNRQPLESCASKAEKKRSKRTKSVTNGKED